jgi:hypothetical protein
MNAQYNNIASIQTASINLNRPYFFGSQLKLLIPCSSHLNSSSKFKLLNINVINFYYNYSFPGLLFITFAARLS